MKILLTAGLLAATYFSVPPSDAPELAPRGPYQVGVRTLEIVHPQQVDILHFEKATGKAPLYDRPLTLEIWYPAQIGPGVKVETTYKMPLPHGQLVNGSPTIDIPDQALRNAPTAVAKTFPLVIVSHGYPGSRYFLSYLSANLASKGYVVAAIDHTDSVLDAQRGFESTLLNRSRDQLFTIRAIADMAAKPDNFLHGLADTSNVAIVGYSMGGYGALTSAGARHSGTGAVMKLVPGGYLTSPVTDSNTMVKAIVAIAPWGRQPPAIAWDAEGIAGIRIPSLFIAGDHDDVADYTNGIKPAFDEAIHSERCLLVYEDARHNTGGNPPPPDLDLPFIVAQFFDEPVWRKTRIISINQHFISAFLDLYLKADQSKLAYLHVQPEKSSDGKWPAPANQQNPAAFSTGKDDNNNLFWKGFQRRGALGLEMSCLSAR